MTNRKLIPEWSAQDGVMLTWPHGGSYWGKHLTRVENNFIEIAYHISCFEQVLINFYDSALQVRMLDALRQRGSNMNFIQSHVVVNNDVWARDHGPITTQENGNLRLLDFRFNGWGGKYPSQMDNDVTRKLIAAGAFNSKQYQAVEFILEGGAIDTDGKGTLLTTSSCLLNKNRNPSLSKSQISDFLCQTLGVERILWINNGELEGDDTDGHIDTLARFCSADTIAYVACANTSDTLYPALSAMEAELALFTDYNGKPYKLLPLPLPDPIYNEQGKRLPATYANFLIINGAVLVPTYRDSSDQQALAVVQQAFPDRKVIGIDCFPLIHQYGSLHCVTMQLPEGILQPIQHGK